jgi:hypothetical protein
VSCFPIKGIFEFESPCVKWKRNTTFASQALGARPLQDADGLNINTARDFINDFRMMLHGKVFHRAMSAPAIDYCLTRIRSERGSSLQDEAIAAVRKHIEYYEGLRNAACTRPDQTPS